MGEMPPDLLQHIKETLKKCDDVFLEHRSLWAVFSDSRLSIWQERLPEDSNVGQRIEGTIHYLHNKKNEQGTNALMLFLQVLRERYSAIDERHSLLLSIMNQFQSVSPSSYKKEVPDVLIEANPMQEPIYAVFETEHIRRCARSIALIEVTRHRKKKSEYPETGTGWLIAPGLVLTCWHVIATLAFADEPPPTAPELQTQIQHMLLSFNHIEIDKGGIQYDVSKLEYSSSEINQQDFAPPTLKEYTSGQGNDEAKAQLTDIKELLLDFTLTTLQSAFGEEQQAWWDEGIPDVIKQKVLQRCNGNEEKLRNKEQFLDTQDYMDIIQAHWDLFKVPLGHSNAPHYSASLLPWLRTINAIQDLVNQDKIVKPKQVDELSRYHDWLRNNSRLQAPHSML